MKSMLANVLLGCAQVSMRSLIVVMKDHSGIDPKSIATSIRWQSFERLVEHVLCPIAKQKIINVDICFDPTNMVVRNIVYYLNKKNEPEMAFIDFESLTVYSFMFNFTTQDYAISPGHVDGEQTAFRFLFLQVLWVAFVWNKAESSDVFDGTEELTAHWFTSIIRLDFSSLHKHLNCREIR
jgi:hypothetical protein